MNIIKKITVLALSTAFLVTLSACAPEVGSEKWCNKMKEKPKAEWTANEVADFAQHCIIK